MPYNHEVSVKVVDLRVFMKCHISTNKSYKFDKRAPLTGKQFATNPFMTETIFVGRWRFENENVA